MGESSGHLRKTAPISAFFQPGLRMLCLDSIEETAVGKVLRIGVPGPFYKDWISSNLMPDLEKAFSSQLPQPFNPPATFTSRTESTTASARSLPMEPLPRLPAPAPAAFRETVAQAPARSSLPHGSGRGTPWQYLHRRHLQFRDTQTLPRRRHRHFRRYRPIGRV